MFKLRRVFLLTLVLTFGLGAVRAWALSENEGLADKPFDLISDGSRITVDDKGISMVAPKGWEVHTSHPSLTLLMQVPYSENLKYQRTIQVASFAGPRFMDEVTAKEYEGIIIRKFSEASASIEDYRIRNHMPIDLADGREALLFYSEFVLDGVPLMQAHILVSSDKRHYLISYTDVAEHFESEDANEFLTEAWETMISVQLDGRTPERFESAYFIAAGAAALAILAILIWLFRNWRAGRSYKNYAAGHGLDDVELTQESHLIGTTRAGTLPTAMDDEDSFSRGHEATSDSHAEKMSGYDQVSEAPRKDRANGKKAVVKMAKKDAESSFHTGVSEFSTNIDDDENRESQIDEDFVV